MRRHHIIFLLFCVTLIIVLFLYPSLIKISVGVTVILFGILNLESGFKIFTEGPLRKILRKSTDNLIKSINVGILSTAILNSSSLISVLVISFISAGLISLKAGIGIVFGSNIGTTFTGWVVALFGLKLDISQLAMPMITFGIIFVLQKSKLIKAWGYVIAGLGFFFLGIFFLKTGFDQYAFNFELFAPGGSRILAILTYTGIGILATIIFQASAATLAVILTALSVHQIAYNDALALAIGSNIGTTFTAVLGSLAANQAGKKLALAHLIFNIITGVVALVFLPQISLAVDYIATLLGIGEQDYTLKLATFHTLFNVLGVVLMVWWVNGLITLLDKLIKDTPPEIKQPKYLNKEILNHPQSAIHAFYKETEHLLDNTFEIMAHSLNVHRTDLLETVKISDLLKHSNKSIDIDINELYAINIKNIYSKIIKYATLVQTEQLSTNELIRLSNIKNANRLIVKVIKDLNDLRKNLNTYLNSDNNYVKDTYNTFRKRLLQIIKELFLNVKNFPYQSDSSEHYPFHRQERDLILIKKNINEQKIKISRLDAEINDIITALISQKLIESNIATSIWNDSIYVSRIGENLLEIMELLYAEVSEQELKS